MDLTLIRHASAVWPADQGVWAPCRFRVTV